MSSQQLATTAEPISAELQEKVLISGDLAKLVPTERLQYYRMMCESLGLNPLTKPFEYISLQNKLTLYARRDCTDQLRKIHDVSVVITSRDFKGATYIVGARATLPNGRTDEATGVVDTSGQAGDQLANTLMKAETKAKRRVTLSIVGLGMMDETETETVTGAQRIAVDMETGEIAPTPDLPTGSGRAPAPQGTMLCPIHNINWFKGGQMDAYGHIVEGEKGPRGGKVWCWREEVLANPPKAEEAPQAEAEHAQVPLDGEKAPQETPQETSAEPPALWATRFFARVKELGLTVDEGLAKLGPDIGNWNDWIAKGRGYDLLAALERLGV